MRFNPKELLDILLAAGMTRDEAVTEVRLDAHKRKCRDVQEVKTINTYLLERSVARPPHLGS